jgi:hypothetical protein
MLCSIRFVFYTFFLLSALFLLPAVASLLIPCKSAKFHLPQLLYHLLTLYSWQTAGLTETG